MSAPSTDGVRVLGIVGAPRSGTTILTRVLGESDGFFAVGEIHNIWQDMLKDRRCACGRRLSRCPVWSSVHERLSAARPPLGPEDMFERRRELTLQRLPVSIVRRGLPAALVPYVGTLAALYRAVAETTGSRVVVDSSKNPRYYSLLSQAGLDVRVVHVVRDPRGVAFSRRRPGWPGSPSGTAVVWNARNAAAEVLWRGDPAYARVRYEDFVATPVETVSGLLGHAGEPDAVPAVGADRTVTLGESHIVSGNRIKRRRGQIEIRLDDDWKTGLPPRKQVLVTALTLPLLSRYGYPIVAARSSRRDRRSSDSRGAQRTRAGSLRRRHRPR